MRATAIATMTSARNEREAALLGASIEQLGNLGLPLYAADAGSTAAFTERARRITQLEIWQAGTTLVQQIKACFRRALQADHGVVLYTEPDKKEFFESGAVSFLEAAETFHADAICIAARNQEGFATFPPGQRSCERAFNDLADNALGITPDLLYGPLVLDLEFAVPCLDEAPDDLGWGWRTYVIARCVLAGKRVSNVTAPFCCPLEQRIENRQDRVYRLTQLKQNVEGLRLALEQTLSQ
jgi:hypothetical protein